METRVQDILTKTNLDFKVIKMLPTSVYQGVEIAAAKHMLINSKTMKSIGTCSAKYGVSQNDEIVTKLLEATDEIRGGKVSIQKGGVIGGGSKIFLQLRIDGYAKVGNDTVHQYITVLDSNDGSCSLSVGIGDFTMSCSNQFNLFYKNSMNKFRHSNNINSRIDNEFVPLILDRLSRSMQQAERYQLMEGTDISKDLVNDLMFQMLRTKQSYSSEQMIAEIKAQAKKGHGVLDMEDILNPSNLGGKARSSYDSLKQSLEHELNEKGNNLWGLHSGVTYWTTHMSKNGGLANSVKGNNYNKNIKSFKFAMNELNIATPEVVLN